MAAVLTLTVDRERRDLDVSKRILELYPNKQPFLVLLSRMGTEDTDTAEFSVWEDRPGAWWTQINNVAGYDDAALTFKVDDETIFLPHDIFYVPRTGETMRVVSTDAANHTVTVHARSWGAAPAAALVDNDWVCRLAPAFPENADAASSRLQQPSKFFNYTEIFKHSYEGSWTQEAEKLKTGQSERARNARRKAMEHEWDQERAFLFGERSEQTVGGEIIRTTGGAWAFITTNVFDLGGQPLTESKWNEILEAALFHGTGEKILFPCPRLATQLNNFALAKLETRSEETRYGVRLKRYISPHGELLIAPPCKVFEKGFADRSLIFDMDNVKKRTLRATTLQKNIGPESKDGYLDQYLTEAGFQLTLEESHTKILGIQ